MLQRLVALFALSCASLSSSVYAEEEAVQATRNGLAQPMIMLITAVFFFYFILWRPEQKRRKAMEKRKNELAKGDQVTAVGIIGTIDQINEHSVILNIASGKIEVLKAAISDVTKPDGTKA